MDHQPNGRINKKHTLRNFLGPKPTMDIRKLESLLLGMDKKRKAISSAFNLIPSWNVAIKKSDVCIFKYAYVHICTYLIHPTWHKPWAGRAVCSPKVKKSNTYAPNWKKKTTEWRSKLPFQSIHHGFTSQGLSARIVGVTLEKRLR